MTNMGKNPINYRRSGQKDGNQHFPEVDARQENPNSQDDEYLPMDVFVDTRTIEERFQYSSNRRRTLPVIPIVSACDID